MTLYSNHHTGSYNGITFLVPSESVQRGKKTVLHEYPNSDNRFVEEFGKIPPIFTLPLIVHGQDSINKRIQLEQELELEGVGKLVHPIYGLLTVNVVGGFDVSSNQKNMGEFTFNVTFAVTVDEAITPSIESIDKSQISQNAQDVKNSLDNALENDYIKPSFADSINNTADKITAIAAELNNKINKIITPVQDNVAAFKSVVDSVTTGVFTIVQNATSVKDTFVDLYESYLDLANLPQDLMDVWNDLIDFGIGDFDYKFDTTKRYETANNLKILNEHTQLTSLIYTYEAAAYTNFQTEQDLNDQISYLDTKFDLLTRTSLDDQSTPRLIKNQAVNEALNTLRTNTKQVLDQKAQKLWKVITLDAGKSSMVLTSFRFYNSLDRLNDLSLLNTNINYASFTKDIQALTK